MRIQDWLQSLGLGDHAAAFARDDIDFDTLADLDDADLEALGLSLGHRKRLLRAIAELGSGTGAADGAGVESVTTASSWSRQAGERKFVTLLFADITGSTALTESLDAEDAHERLYGAVQRMCEAVEQHRGTLCRFMGDGVMAMFGAPIAFEGHAVEACLAALELQRSIRSYADALQRESGCRIEARVGVHAGDVVVLRVGGTGAESYDASGANVALAARLEQTAAPGTVQLSASTFSLVSSRFEAAPLPPVRAKGFSESVAAVRLERQSSGAIDPQGASFVGRRAELEQLQVLLERCLRESSGRCVVLRGEPGIGKSRLAERIADSATRRGFRVHRSHALDFGWGRGQDAARLLLRDLLALDPDAAAPDRAAAAERAIAQGLATRDMHAHLLDLLDLPPPPEMEAAYAALPAHERARQRHDLLAGVVRRCAAREPRLLLVEDLHWVQPAVRAYLAAVASALPECPALMLLTTRPDDGLERAGFEQVTGDSPVTMHLLGPLSPSEAQALAGSFGVADAEFVRRCVERSGRNPLFLEQLLRSHGEHGGEDLPGSIQILVAAQADRLPEVDKQAVQAGAVLGKEFDLAALRAVVARPDYDPALLTERRFLRREGDRLAFHHALVQEGVLSSLLRRDRRDLHGAAARWFAGRDAVLHARHLDLADDADAARAYLEAARAEAASNRFVFASELVGRGLELASGTALAFGLQTLHGDVLAALGRTADAANAFRAAAALAEDGRDRCRAWLGAAHALRIIGSYDDALMLLDDAETAIGTDDALTRERAQIAFVRGTIHFLQMDGARCEREQRRAYEMARACGDAEMEAWALTGLARSCYLTGRLCSAAAHARQYLQLCLDHGLELVRYAQIHMLGITRHFELDIDGALEGFGASREHAPRLGVPRQAVIGATEGASALMNAGRLPEASEFARSAVELSRRVGERRYEPIARAVMLSAEADEAGAADRDGVVRELEALWQRLDSDERSFSGWRVLGAMMHVGDEAVRRSSAERASRLPRDRCFGLARIHFLHDAIAASLRAAESTRATAFANQLEELVNGELTALSELHLSWARASAALDRPALERVRAQALQAGLTPMATIIADQLEADPAAAHERGRGGGA